jgi:hypothetical protein
VGIHNSSLTRVRPVFNALFRKDKTGASWLWKLWVLGSQVGRAPAEPGALVEAEVTDLRDDGPPRAFERTAPPPREFLEWLLWNPLRMAKWDEKTWGASSADAIEMRRRLFALDEAAREEGTAALARRGPEGSLHQWWAFEGFTHFDCCLSTPSSLLIIEGKRTETVSPATRWFPKRNQLWRNVECARQLAGEREYGVLLAVEDEAHGHQAMKDAAATRDESLPHLSPDGRDELARHLRGFVTWKIIVRELKVPENVLVERLAEKAH